MKTAFICRREIASYRNDNNHAFSVQEYGFLKRTMSGSVSSRWPQVPCRNDHSGTIRGGNCDRNTGNTQHCSSCLFHNYKESDKCQSHRDTPAGVIFLYWTLRSFKVQEWRNGGLFSQTWVVCELSACHIGLPGEEDGIIRDATVHRRGCSFSAWTSSRTIHPWRYRLRRSQSVFINLCRNFSMNVTWNGTKLDHTHSPVYLGITLDRSPTYRNHCLKTRAKLSSRNNLLGKLHGTNWCACPPPPPTHTP